MNNIELKNIQIEELCHALSLKPFSEKYTELSTTKEFVNNELSYQDLLISLLSHTLATRTNNALNRKLKKLNLQHTDASRDKLIFDKNRDGFNKRTIEPLFELQWCNEHRNLIIEGATGTGKTYLADALSITALLSGKKIYKISFDDLMFNVQVDETLIRRLPLRLKRCYDIVYIDDWCLSGINEHGKDLIKRLAYELEGKVSLLLTTQRLRTGVIDYLGVDIKTDGTVSRIYDAAISLQLGGSSLRALR